MRSETKNCILFVQLNKGLLWKIYNDHFDHHLVNLFGLNTALVMQLIHYLCLETYRNMSSEGDDKRQDVFSVKGTLISFIFSR